MSMSINTATEQCHAHVFPATRKTLPPETTRGRPATTLRGTDGRTDKCRATLAALPLGVVVQQIEQIITKMRKVGVDLANMTYYVTVLQDSKADTSVIKYCRARFLGSLDLPTPLHHTTGDLQPCEGTVSTHFRVKLAKYSQHFGISKRARLVWPPSLSSSPSPTMSPFTLYHSLLSNTTLLCHTSGEVSEAQLESDSAAADKRTEEAPGARKREGGSWHQVGRGRQEWDRLAQVVLNAVNDPYEQLSLLVDIQERGWGPFALIPQTAKNLTTIKLEGAEVYQYWLTLLHIYLKIKVTPNNSKWNATSGRGGKKNFHVLLWMP
ncbi:hypothetical protein BC835DRAFT_1305438 [Cytidiella melzeri]|nr:hypothetical protein BC835DRAFT_1305438 [Cytidiella melzeri]